MIFTTLTQDLERKQEAGVELGQVTQEHLSKPLQKYLLFVLDPDIKKQTGKLINPPSPQIMCLEDGTHINLVLLATRWHCPNSRQGLQ